MYKDRDRQREVNKLHARAYRKRKGMTQGMMPVEGMTVVPDGMIGVVRGMSEFKPRHLPNCRCRECLS